MKIKFLILYIFLNTNLSSQNVTLHIFNQKKIALKNVSVYYNNENSFQTTDNNGISKIFINTDKIKITHIGYFDTIIFIKAQIKIDTFIFF